MVAGGSSSFVAAAPRKQTGRMAIAPKENGIDKREEEGDSPHQHVDIRAASFLSRRGSHESKNAGNSASGDHKSKALLLLEDSTAKIASTIVKREKSRVSPRSTKGTSKKKKKVCGACTEKDAIIDELLSLVGALAATEDPSFDPMLSAALENLRKEVGKTREAQTS